MMRRLTSFFTPKSSIDSVMIDQYAVRIVHDAEASLTDCTTNCSRLFVCMPVKECGVSITFLLEFKRTLAEEKTEKIRGMPGYTQLNSYAHAYLTI